MSATRTARLENHSPEELREFLDALGYAFSEADYAHFQARGDGAVIVLYRSGKVVVQGKGGPGLWDYLEKGGFVPSEKDDPAAGQSRIGSDECGKGDYFGPLVVVGCGIRGNDEEALKALGVRDSKNLSDARMKSMVGGIRRMARVSVVKIGPARYNEMHREMANVNKMLAWAHARVIEEILGDGFHCDLAIVDQFAKGPGLSRALGPLGKRITVEPRVRAESDPVVAAASIVARTVFLDSMDRLSEEVGFPLPKGATHVVDAGRRAVAEHGDGILARIAKVHFKTTQRVLV